MPNATNSGRPTFRAFDANVRSRIADVRDALEYRVGKDDAAYVASVQSAIMKLRTAVATLPDTKDRAEETLAQDLAHDAANVAAWDDIASEKSGLSLAERAQRLSSQDCAESVRHSAMAALLPVQQTCMNAREFVIYVAEAFRKRAEGAQLKVHRVAADENVRVAASYLVPIAKECARNARKYGVEGTQKLEVYVDGNYQLVIRFSNIIAPHALTYSGAHGQEINARFAKLLGCQYVSERRDPWKPGPAEWVVELTFPMSW